MAPKVWVGVEHTGDIYRAASVASGNININEYHEQNQCFTGIPERNGPLNRNDVMCVCAGPKLLHSHHSYTLRYIILCIEPKVQQEKL